MNNPIKDAINEELADLVVSKRLRKSTLKQFKTPKFSFKSSFYFKVTTVLSSFLILLVLGFNVFVGDNSGKLNPEAESIRPKILPDIYYYPYSNSSAEGFDFYEESIKEYLKDYFKNKGVNETTTTESE